MKVKLDRIPVGGFWYDIVCSPEWDKKLQEMDCLGRHFVDNYGRHLVIHSSQPEAELSHTLIHEIAESINQVFLCGSLEHSELSAMVSGFHQIFEHLGIRLSINDNLPKKK